jgi:hypothetical protein
MFAGAANLLATPSRFTNRAYRGYGLLKGMTTTQIDDFIGNLYTFLVAWGAA